MVKAILTALLFILFTAPLLAQETEPSTISVQEEDARFEEPYNYDRYEEIFESESESEEGYLLPREDDPSDELSGAFAFLFLGGFWGFFVCIWIVAIASLIFNIIMLVDCANREFKDKTLWIVLLVVGLITNLGIIISLLYYFLVKKKLDEERS